MLGNTSPVQPVIFAFLGPAFVPYLPMHTAVLMTALFPRNMLLLTVVVKEGEPKIDSAPPAYLGSVAVLSANTQSVTDTCGAGMGWIMYICRRAHLDRHHGKDV